MAKLISSILTSALRGMQTAIDKIIGLGTSMFATGLSAFGFGGGSPFPSQPPVFDAPVAANDLFADLAIGPEPISRVRDLAREGVNCVFKLAKMSKDQRATADLSAVKRDDVRALLLQMTQSELDAVTKAGADAVCRLIVGGDAQVWGVPSVRPRNVLPPSDTELAMRLRTMKAMIAKPKSSKPYTMPSM